MSRSKCTAYYLVLGNRLPSRIDSGCRLALGNESRAASIHSNRDMLAVTAYSEVYGTAWIGGTYRDGAVSWSDGSASDFNMNVQGLKFER